MESRMTFEEKYNSIGTKNKSFEGLFYTAVKTTGIFCRPTCMARKPKIENVIFYDHASEAIDQGYRPCKRCNPLDSPGTVPKDVQHLLDYIRQHPDKKIKDNELIQWNIEPNKIRRWFKANFEMTFHQYQRKHKINQAHRQLSGGKRVSDAAYDAGFESISGFNESYRNIVGKSPKAHGKKEIINQIRVASLLGPIFIGGTSKGICLLEFADKDGLEKDLDQLAKRYNAIILPGNNEHLDQAKTEIENYFDGRLKTFEVALDMRGTPFQIRTWKALQEIPYGFTRSYSDQAKLVGDKNAVRAVAAANGRNKIAIIIPCHRVIGSNGKLTGYAGGIERKKWLLDFENPLFN